MGLFPSRTSGLKRARQAVHRIEEQFGEGTIRPLAELGGEKPAAIPLRVAVDEDGWPALLFVENRTERVQEVCNRWRVVEEWWRREIARDYYRVITEGGHLYLIFQDLAAYINAGQELAPCPPGEPLDGMGQGLASCRPDGSPAMHPTGEQGGSRTEGMGGSRITPTDSRPSSQATWFLERVYG